MHCNQILKLINTLLWITNLDAPKVAFEKEPYKVINWKFSGESQIFQLFALSSFLFLSSLEKRNRNALVLIVSWKFQDLNYSKVFIFCPFDSSLVAACYECFFSDDIVSPKIYLLTTVSKLEAAECISQCLSDIQCMWQTPVQMFLLYRLGGICLRKFSVKLNRVNWISI